jgi:predicted hydrocarbon binding protein
MNYSIEDLIQSEATMNQMRNYIYQLVRFMEKNGVKDLKERLRRMGKNIAKTYAKYWKPTQVVNISNLKDVITTIYQKVLNSYVSIEVDDIGKFIIIKDSKCPLCKYHYEDVEIAGCEIIIGMVSELISLMNSGSIDPSGVSLEPFDVKESRSYGNNSCTHIYKYRIGGMS